MYRRMLAPAAVLATCVFGLLPAGSAHADSSSTLPITSFYQMVVDSAHGHLFISQGSASADDILVTNLAGAQVATISGQDGAMGLALSPDGSTLYAALGSADAVSAISTSTLLQTASYSLGAGNSPQDLALQSGKLWVSYTPGTVGEAAIGDIDLSATTPAFQAQAGMGAWYGPPQLAADPQDTGVLVAVEPGESPASVASYNTTVNPVTVRAQSESFSNCYNEKDLAVAPGGSEFVLACGAPYAHYRYSTADLSEVGAYASAPYPDSVAIDAKGDVAAGTSESMSSADVYIYSQDGSTPLATYNLSGSGDLAPRGLAWSADGSRLFAIVGNQGNDYSLQILDNPTFTSSTLSLTGPSSAYLGRQFMLTGSLTVAGEAAPAGTAVTITRSVQGSKKTAQFAVTTTADGSYTLTDTPPAVGQYTYTASYSGNSTTASSTASQAVAVTLAPSALSLTGPSSAYLSRPITLTGSLTVAGEAAPARTAITVTRSVKGSTQTAQFNVTTKADGSYTLTDTPPAVGQYTYTGSYSGNSTTASSTASQAVAVTLAKSAVRLTGPSSVRPGQPIALTGVLTVAGEAAPAGTAVTMTRSVHGSKKTAQFTVTTRANGAFKLTDTPPARGKYTYVAAYSGNSTTKSSSASHAVTVSWLRAALTLRTSRTTYTYEPVVHVTAHLGKTYKNRKVSIYARRLGSGTRHLLKTGKVNSAGNLAVSYPAAHSTVFSVVFAGDAHDLRTTATRSVYVRAKVSESISGYYGHKSIGGITYWLYHPSSVLHSAATVAPDKAGECVKFFVQEHYRGAWRANTSTSCIRISHSSTASASFGVAHADHGYHYRIRAEFLPRNGDNTNVSNYSGWRYLIVYK